MATKAAVQKKSSGSSKLKAAAQKVKDYKQALQDAYDRGYGDGYAAAADIPNIAFPKDFQAAHNRYSKLLEYERTQELCKRFTDQAKKLRFACFRQGDLSLRVIRTPAELKIWAKRFRNCAAGRADRVASGRSLMCVIVNVHKPKEPYFMLEYDLQGRTIVECRGYENRKTEKDDPAAEEFCGKWLNFIEQRGATLAGKKKAGLAA